MNGLEFWASLIVGMTGGFVYYMINQWLDRNTVRRMAGRRFRFEFKHPNGSVMKSDIPFTLGEIKVFAQVATDIWKVQSERKDQQDDLGGEDQAG